MQRLPLRPGGRDPRPARRGPCGGRGFLRPAAHPAVDQAAACSCCPGAGLGPGVPSRTPGGDRHLRGPAREAGPGGRPPGHRPCSPETGQGLGEGQCPAGGNPSRMATGNHVGYVPPSAISRCANRVTRGLAARAGLLGGGARNGYPGPQVGGYPPMRPRRRRTFNTTEAPEQPMYTLAPEDHFRYWAEDEARRARGHIPVPAETGRMTTRPGLRRVWRSAIARRSLPVGS